MTSQEMIPLMTRAVSTTTSSWCRGTLLASSVCSVSSLAETAGKGHTPPVHAFHCTSFNLVNYTNDFDNEYAATFLIGPEHNCRAQGQGQGQSQK